MKRTRRVLLLTAVLCLAARLQAQVPTGTPPFGSFGGGPFDVVDLGNLNAHFSIAVRHKAGRITPFTYDIGYDTSVWYPTAVNGVQTWQPTGGYGWSIPGGPSGHIVAQLVATVTQPCNPPNDLTPVTYHVYGNYAYYDAVGSSHPFSLASSDYAGGCAGIHPPTGGTANATDSSGYVLTLTALGSTTVTGPDGRIYLSPTTSNTVLTDSNGNQITVDGSGNFTDTLGTNALSLSGTFPKYLKYTAPNASLATWTINYTSYTVQTKFGCSGVAEYTLANVQLPTSIVLPNSTSYQFTYEQTQGYGSGYTTGRLASVTLPTGGSISYTYPTRTVNSVTYNGINCADGTAPASASVNGAASMTRTVSPGGTWSYYRTQVSGNHWQTKTTSPAANDTVVDFQQDSSTVQYGNTQNFFEVERQTYQGSSSSGTLLSTILTCYNTANPSPTTCPTTSVSTPISRVTNFSYLPDTSSGSKVAETDAQYGYISDQQFPTEIDSYDYGTGSPGSLVRKVFNSFSIYGNVVRPTSTSVQDAGGNTKSATNFSYDGASLTTTTSPQHITPVNGSARGNLTRVALQASGTVTLYRNFTYYDTGTVNTATDWGTTTSGGPNTTTYTYGSTSCGNSFVTALSEPLSLSRSFAWDCNGGVATSATDENGQTSTTYYAQTSSFGSPDPNFWRPYAAADQLGNGATISYPSNTVGETALLFNSGHSVVDQRTKFDQFGRPILRQMLEGPGSSTYDSTETDYDNLGRVSKTYIPFTNAADALCSGTCPNTTTTYDALNRPLTMTDGGGGTVTYTYTKNDVLQVVGPQPAGENTKQRQTEYEGLGRLSSVCEITAGTSSAPGGACGQTVAQTGYLTKYAYDVMGNLIGVTQNAQGGSQQTRSYTFDMLSRTLTEQNPETGTTTYTYDTADATCGSYSSPGDLVEKRDAVGNVTCAKYDALHRVTQTTYPSGGYASRTPTKCFVYDSATVNGTAMGNAKTRLAEGYTTSASSCPGTPTVDEGFSYSARGEITNTWEKTPNSSGYYHPTTAYWPSGAVQTLWISTLPAITYNPDGEGRTSTVSASSGQNPVTATAYNTAGQVTNVTLGSGDSDSFTSDPNTGRMTQYKYTINGSSEVGNLTWNQNGSLKTLATTDPFNAGDAQTCNYVHDDLSRIASANCGTPWSQTFTYDALGNVTKSGSITWQPGYSVSTNRYTLAGTSYDSNGNLLNDSFHSYTWDTDSNPATIDAIGLTYDAFDRVVEQNQSGTYYQIVYTPTGAKLGLFKAQVIQQLYVPLPGGAKAEYLSWGLSHYRHPDWLGSDRLESDASNHSIKDNNAYAPFGEPYAQTGNGEISFTGQNKDTVWLQYDFLFRQYDPKQGRWLSPDPAGLAVVDPTNPQSWNRYAYVLNNPLAMIDPYGDEGCYVGGVYQAGWSPADCERSGNGIWGNGPTPQPNPNPSTPCSPAIQGCPGSANPNPPGCPPQATNPCSAPPHPTGGNNAANNSTPQKPQQPKKQPWYCGTGNSWSHPFTMPSGRQWGQWAVFDGATSYFITQKTGGKDPFSKTFAIASFLEGWGWATCD